MFKKYSKIILIVLAMIVIGNLLVVSGAGAEHAIIEKLKLTRSAAELPKFDDPTSIVVLLIKGALGLLVIIFFIMILIAGFRWMTAGGNEETVSKAKRNIINAVIGVTVVIMAYAITSFVFDIILSEGVAQ